MSADYIAVIDLETNGLDPEKHRILMEESALHNYVDLALPWGGKPHDATVTANSLRRAVNMIGVRVD